ncbi:endolytic transglycosylase MltG [Ornithinimicrobium sp. Arc0846-15]|nr:endolytic transglycosylase MltG [Ornithinimicrobium laminariae]
MTPPDEDINGEFTSRRAYKQSKGKRGRRQAAAETPDQQAAEPAPEAGHEAGHELGHESDAAWAGDWGVPAHEAHPDDLHPDDVHPHDGHPDDVHPHDGPVYDADGHPIEHDVPIYDDHYAAGVALPGETMNHRDPAPRRRSPVVRYGSILVALALVFGGGYFAFNAIRGALPTFSMSESQTAEDYEGEGTGEIVVTIPSGAGGAEIAQILAENDVVASAAAFTAVATVDSRSQSIQPGSYTLAQQMSAQSALDRLVDPAFKASGVTVREGLWVDETFEILAEGTGNEVADYEAVDPESLDLPDAANGELEGYLFPSTYDFAEDSTPEEQLQTMIDQGKKVFAEEEIPDDELGDIIIEASLIQAEAAFSDDLPKVARVIENRLDDGEALAMDSSIHFIFQERGLAGTTDAQRASDSPYNTYLLPGLPPGPIDSPGRAAINAAMNPADGPWKFFVTVNPTTGETNFAETFEEHEENVALFQQWCADNPDDC